MSITPLASAGAALPGDANRPDRAAPAGDRSPLAADFQSFLTMLTVQMRNQDPLNPMQSSDFAVQLATFAGVEQQVRTNSLLSEMAAASGLSDLARSVGMEARVDGPVNFDGQPLQLWPEPVSGATEHVLVAYGPLGNMIGRAPVTPGAGPVTWSGLGPDGQPLPPGSYRFEVAGLAGDTVVGSGAVLSYSRIQELVQDAGAQTFVLADGRRVPASAITGLRAPADD